MNSNVDISESFLLRRNPAVMMQLLKDHTTQRNIFWATDSYALLGKGYQEKDEINIDKVTGDNEGVIRPRCVKSKEEQTQRTKDKAEVFTPSWICNKQNNLVDNAWFGRENVFNTEIDTVEEHTWKPTEGKIEFPNTKGKTWRDYVRDTRLEITCGEAPYLASRYDTITGDFIPVGNRIGLLDRKLRVVSENTETTGEWLEMAQEAFKNIYGYEWQGDNVLLARESLLMTFIEYYKEKFNSEPLEKSIEYIAYIVSWNIWQMDGLKFVVPMSCHDIEDIQTSFFDDTPRKSRPCPGCKHHDYLRHNGTYCDIMDWEEGHPIKFYSLMRKEKK